LSKSQNKKKSSNSKRLDTKKFLSLEGLKEGKHKITFLSNPLWKGNHFYEKYINGSWDVSKEGDKTGFFTCHKTDSYHSENICPICEKEEQMTLQDLINRINMYRKNQNLDDIWIHSRPSSSGSGTTMEIRCGVAMNGKLLAKSSNGGALNFFLKGMLTAFQNDAAPSISGFNAQLAAITRSNYTRTVDKED
jgi:hypothetical protein